jgi:hypothetical protein
MAQEGGFKKSEITKDQQSVIDKMNSEITFIENKGQFDSKVKYLAKMPGQNVWFTKKGIRFDAYKTEVVCVKNKKQKTKNKKQKKYKKVKYLI